MTRSEKEKVGLTKRFEIRSLKVVYLIISNFHEVFIKVMCCYFFDISRFVLNTEARESNDIDFLASHLKFFNWAQL